MTKQEIIDNFNLLPDWQSKYEYLISLSKDLEPMDTQYHTDKYLVPGCQSQVWLHAEESNGKWHFQANSDALITKGLIAILITPLQNKTTEEIKNEDFTYITDISLHQHLSLSRANGLHAMIQKIQSL